MHTLRVAGATLNQSPLDWEGNVARHREILAAARKLAVDVICFPELSLSSYGCEDLFLHPEIAERAEVGLRMLLPETAGCIAVFGLPLWHQGFLYNCAVVVSDSKIVGIHPKKVLPRDGVHYEPRWFTAAPMDLDERHSLCGEEVPFGNFCYGGNGFKFAIELCEEAWVREFSAAEHKGHGLDLVLSPSVSHFAFGKLAVREKIITDASREFGATYLQVNALGVEGGRTIYDGAVLFADEGAIVARGPLFGFQTARFFCYDVTLQKERASKGVRSRLVPLQGKTNGAKPPLPPAIAATVPDKEEEFLYSVTRGLFDYLGKTKARGFALSLSGGVDSSACAVLVAQMVALALKELGPVGLSAALDMAVPEHAADKWQSWMPLFLTTIYQKTAQSGAATEQAAARLAKALNCRHHVVDVEGAVQDYIAMGAKILGRPLNWEKDDTALQNIQARARAPMVWLVANLENKLLLSTSNRSELAVGYATMDGDTAGGLSPLAGIDKAYLRRWLQWAEKECGVGTGPIAALQAVNQFAPTAELRPSSAQQTDEKDLMPYSVLARIEELFVFEKKAAPAILNLLVKEFPQFEQVELEQFVRRFFHLFPISQWKRERAAPGFHLDRFSLDPKGWGRFPILSAAPPVFSLNSDRKL